MCYGEYVNVIRWEGSKIYVCTPAILPCICVIDILFFPYIRFLSCSLSAVLIAIWYLLHLRRSEVKDSIPIIVLVVVSTVIGYWLYDSLDGIVASAILILSFLLLFYFRTYNHYVPIKNIFIAYLVFVFALAVLYCITPQTYFAVRAFWSMSGNVIEYSDPTINRFTAIFSDPNNAGVAVVAVMTYLLLFEKFKKKITVALCIAMAAFTSFITFSVTANIVLGMVLVAMLLINYRNKKNYVAAILVLLIVVLVAAMLLRDIIEKSVVYNSLLYRLTNASFDSAGGRQQHWNDTINNALSWYNVFIGKGAVIDDMGMTYLPHSGVLYIFVSYGAIACIVFAKSFFMLRCKEKIKTLLAYAPLLFVFLLNTGISDYRFMMMAALLCGAVQNRNRADRFKKCLC